MKKVNVFVITIFILFAIIIGMNHEPWVDEAQSWMISRDASVSEIIWNISRYEGTFPLWFLTLKSFIMLGLEYKYLFVVPIIISSLGVILFETKVKAPTYIKILLPFTFYIFYQYTAIARSYSFLFLAFSFWLISHEKRFERPFRYILSLLFFSFISMHGMIMSGIFGIIFFIEICKENKLKQNWYKFLFIGIVWIFEFIILIPRGDLYMTVSSVFSIKDIILSIIYMIMGNGNIFLKAYNVINAFILIWLFIKLLMLKNKDISIVTICVFFFMFIIRFCAHHLGIIYLLIVFGVLAYYDEINSKHLKNVFIVLLIMNCIYSIQTGIYDYKNAYSGSKQMAEYIIENGYDQKEIYGFGYKDVALEPYFEGCVYKNWEDSIYRWSKKNKDFYTYCNIEEFDLKSFKNKPEYIVVENNEQVPRVVFIKNIIENTGLYELEYQTNGYEFFKNSYSEKECYSLYKLK